MSLLAAATPPPATLLLLLLLPPLPLLAAVPQLKLGAILAFVRRVAAFNQLLYLQHWSHVTCRAWHMTTRT